MADINPAFVDKTVRETPTGLTWFIAFALVIVNLVLAPIWMSKIHASAGGLFGEVTGRAILTPLIVVALFQIGKSFRNSRSRLLVFNWTSVLIVSVSLQKIIIPTQEIEADLEALNRNLPMMVDEGLRLDSYEADGDVFIMNITTVGMLADEIDIDSWMSESASRVQQSACSDPDYRAILESGVIYEYRYRDEQGAPVVSVRLSQADCQ